MRRLILVLSVLAVLLVSGAAVSAQGVVHTVAPGENLFRISLRYNVTIAAIVAENGIANPNLIFPGQQLRIPGTAGVPVPQPQPPTPVPGGSQPPPTGASQYTVVAGDTLGAISRRFNTTVQAIASANGIANVNLIHIGQVLTIPGGTGVVSPPPSGPSVPPSSAGTGGFELGGQVFSFAYPSQMRGAGMTWAKIQLRWQQGQPASIAQGAIESAHSKGFKVLLSIAGDKNQIAANPTQYYQDFANFLAGVAALGPEGVEVWNEQNIDREWPVGLISGTQYTQMLSAAYQAIKRANSNVLVVGGAPSPTGFFGGCGPNGCDDAPFISAMAAAGAASFMDCMGIHYNEGILPPTATSGDPRGSSSHYTRYYASMVSVYSSTFPGKPLCFTELGYLSPEGYGPLPGAFAWASGVTVQNQAEWLASAVNQARASGRIRLFIVWNVDSELYAGDPQAGYAIIRPDRTCRACITLGAVMGVQ
jgi:LysM repeat protein